MQDDEKNIEIRKKLLTLPKVKAGDDFLIKLQHKINLIDAGEKKSTPLPEKRVVEKFSFLERIKEFGFGKYIPALSLTIIIFFIFVIGYVALQMSNKSDNLSIPDSQTPNKIQDLPVTPVLPENSNNNTVVPPKPTEEKPLLQDETAKPETNTNEVHKPDLEPKIESKEMAVPPPPILKQDVQKSVTIESQKESTIEEKDIPDKKAEKSKESKEAVDKEKKPAEMKKEQKAKEGVDNLNGDNKKIQKTIKDTLDKVKQKIEVKENK